MPDQRDQIWDEFLETLRSRFRTSLHDQIARQRKVNPGISLDRLKQMQIDQLAQQLQRLADEADEAEKFRERDMWEKVIEALPELIGDQG